VAKSGNLDFDNFRQTVYHLVIKLTDGKIYAKDNDTYALLGSA
jgi:hypothetical protein